MEILVQRKPREQGGPNAYRAYDFQIHASMARILMAQSEGISFQAYFDHFDDLIFIEGGEGALAVSFFQVKARMAGAWTPTRLAHRPKKGDAPKSIIGKAYSNLHEFGKCVRKAAILSNQHLQATLSDGTAIKPDHGEILLSSLCEEDRCELLSALGLDFPDGLDPRHGDVLVFERIPLDPQSFRQTLQGQVTDFVDALGPGYAAAAKPVYDALLSEISRCTGTVSNPKSLKELQKQKSLSDTDVSALVERVKQRTQAPVEWWPTVASELSQAGWKAIPIHRLRLECEHYWNARRRGAGVATDLSKRIQKLIEHQSGLIGDSVVNSVIGLELAYTSTQVVGERYTERAAILVEIMESMT